MNNNTTAPARYYVVFGTQERGYKFPIRLFTEADGGFEAAQAFARKYTAKDQREAWKQLPEEKLDAVFEIIRKFMPSPLLAEIPATVVIFENGEPVKAECYCKHCEAKRLGLPEPEDEEPAVADSDPVVTRLPREVGEQLMKLLGLDEEDEKSERKMPLGKVGKA